MLGVLGWVGSLRLQKQGCDLLPYQERTHLINNTRTMAVVGLQNNGSMTNSPFHSPGNHLLTSPQGPWDLPNSAISHHFMRNAKLNSEFTW